MTALIGSHHAPIANANDAASGPAGWSANPTTGVTTESLVFEHAGAALSGTLYLPRTNDPVAVVVATHGASSPLRTSPLYSHLTTMLPALGIGVFTYDRRGSGRSSGTNNGDYGLLADDAVAAIEMLSKDPRIDARRMGVWGLSQGGWISLLAASRGPKIAFAISVSAPVVTADVQMMFFSINSLRVNGYSPADIGEMVALRAAVDDYMRGKGSQAEAQRRIDTAKSRPWFKYLYLGDTVRDREVSGWRKEIENDPLAALSSVDKPLLMLFGASDPVVPVAWSVKRLSQMSAQLPKMEVAVVAGADHTMQTSVDPKIQLDPAYADTGHPESPEYFARLAAWLTNHGISSIRGR